MNELREIIEKFAASDYELISVPSKAWLEGKCGKAELAKALEAADKQCGSCGCEFDALYKKALDLLKITTIALGCDHGGYDLKLAIMKQLDTLPEKYNYIDLGHHDGGRCDYPVYADIVCRAITDGRADCGILFCGTGLGMSMTANKHKGIRAACLSDAFSAQATRDHNDANVLCLGGRVVGEGLAWELVRIFLETPFSNGERHIERVRMIMSYDEK